MGKTFIETSTSCASQTGNPFLWITKEQHICYPYERSLVLSYSSILGSS